MSFSDAHRYLYGTWAYNKFHPDNLIVCFVDIRRNPIEVMERRVYHSLSGLSSSSPEVRWPSWLRLVYRPVLVGGCCPAGVAKGGASFSMLVLYNHNLLTILYRLG